MRLLEILLRLVSRSLIRYSIGKYAVEGLTNSQWYLVVGLVGLPLTVTIRVSRVSAMISVRFSVN